MKIRKQDGFSAVEGLLILVVVVVIGLVGWFVYQKQQTSKDKSSQRATKNQTITELVASVKEKVSQEVPAVKVTGAEEDNYSDSVSYKVANFDYLSTVAVGSKVVVYYTPKKPAQFETEDQEASASQQNEQTLSPAKDIILNVLRENGFN